MRHDDHAIVLLMREFNKDAHDVRPAWQGRDCRSARRRSPLAGSCSMRGQLPRAAVRHPTRCRMRSFAYRSGKCTCLSRSSAMSRVRPVESLAARVHREHDILKHGEAGQQIETLEDHADVAAAVAVPVHLRQIVPPRTAPRRRWVWFNPLIERQQAWFCRRLTGRRSQSHDPLGKV